ncbi:MAG TPA: M48 family metalloprotease [Candidatus Acidoferrales bacterium]|nr:M48 family metalloprotease [Candidatus Acidoferrales bacterium]
MFRKFTLLLVVFVAVTALCEVQKPAANNSAFDRVLGQVVAREAENVKALRQYSPVVETYLQEMRPDKDLGEVPVSDRYFLGRVSITKELDNTSFVTASKRNTTISGGFVKRMTGKMKNAVTPSHTDFNPTGFSYMLLIDQRGLDREHYSFEYVGREFLGELRCYVIDVTPKKKSGVGRFQGRIWVEDQAYNIVRFNGTFVNPNGAGHYLHFDTWRLNLQPGVWLPSYVYSEEGSVPNALPKDIGYKGQIRVWGYNVGRSKGGNAFTDVVVDDKTNVNDQSEAHQDLSPVAAQRAWERQAEDNALARLEFAGLLAPVGEVDKVLNTVVANLMITNNLEIQPEVRCRVLLTAPIESFNVGHTIVVSRGMLDVLPDEASLAAVLAHELAHIALAHHNDTRYAFSDQLIFNDEYAFQKMHFGRGAQDEEEADRKAVQLLQNSPYKDKLNNVGLFLRALDSRRAVLPHLIKAQLGNTLAQNNHVRLPELMNSAPRLEPLKTDQVAALPMGGRIKLDPWSNRIEISRSKGVALLGAREKMPFEVTPFFPFLTRLQAGTAAPTSAPAEAPVPSSSDKPVIGDSNEGSKTAAATPVAK